MTRRNLILAAVVAVVSLGFVVSGPAHATPPCGVGSPQFDLTVSSVVVDGRPWEAAGPGRYRSDAGEEISVGSGTTIAVAGDPFGAADPPTACSVDARQLTLRNLTNPLTGFASDSNFEVSP